MNQPTEIPGNFEIAVQPFPSAEWAINRPYAGYPVYGLFTGGQSYVRYRDDINAVFGKDCVLRLNDWPTPAQVEMLEEDGHKYIIHAAGGKHRNVFDSDTDYLSYIREQCRTALDVYGTNPGLLGLATINEPNYEYMIEGPMTFAMQRWKADLFGAVLTECSKIIRAGWPELPIFGFDLGGAGMNATEFMQMVYLYHPKIHECYDYLATHPGVDPVPPGTNKVEPWGKYSIAGSVRDLRGVMRTVPGKRKPVVFTEGGWDDRISEELRAAYYVRRYALALRLGVPLVTSFFVEDLKVNRSGIFAAPGHWRPAAHAIKTMRERMPRPKLVAVISDGPDLHWYRFWNEAHSIDAGETEMIWTVSGPITLDGHDTGPIPTYI